MVNNYIWKTISMYVTAARLKLIAIIIKKDTDNKNDHENKKSDDGNFIIIN